MAPTAPRYPTPIKFYPPANDPKVALRIKKAAKSAGQSVSEWLYEAARTKMGEPVG